MEKFVVKGGRRLLGTVPVSGSKNVALKVVIASLLTDEEVTIENVPRISDLLVLLEIVEDLGAQVSFSDHTLRIKSANLTDYEIPLEAGARIRTSSMLIAPLILRFGRVLIPNPGGCRIGTRPIDRTIEGLESMGVAIRYVSEDGYFHASTKELHGTRYRFEKNTHTGTETLLIAATLAKGKSIFANAATEPEVDDLIAFLISMGAKITRAGRTITVEGVGHLHGTHFSIMPDRNEAVTFAVSGLITGGELTVEKISRIHIEAFLTKLTEAGGGWEEAGGSIRFFKKGQLLATDVTTAHHPGFMTDWQSPWAVLMTQAKGTSTIHETIFENRFTYVEQLKKMGADIELFNPRVKNAKTFYNFNIADDRSEFFHAGRIRGPGKLHNGVVNISDLRAGATMVLAALAAKGETTIFGVEQLDRGYEQFDSRLKALGADIRRVGDD